MSWADFFDVRYVLGFLQYDQITKISPFKARLAMAQNLNISRQLGSLRVTSLVALAHILTQQKKKRRDLRRLIFIIFFY